MSTIAGPAAVGHEKFALFVDRVGIGGNVVILEQYAFRLDGQVVADGERLVDRACKPGQEFTLIIG
ncbi:MAG: hypothetical protein ACRD3I_13425, partial [Terriglobales bacterium]